MDPQPSPAAAAVEVSLLEAVGTVGLLILDEGLAILHANRGAENLTGYSAGELAGRPLAEALFPDPVQAARLAGLAEAAAQTRSAGQAGLVYRSRQNLDKTMIASLFPAPGEAPARLCFLFQDFTARRAWEESIRSTAQEFQVRLREEIARHEETLRRYRDFFDNAPDMYHVIDREGRIVECNKAEEALLGWSREELIGKSLFDLVPPDEVDRVRDAVQRLMEGQRVHNLLRRFRRKDGGVFEVLVHATPLVDARGTVTGAMSLFRDITEIRRCQREIEEGHASLERIHREQGAYFAQASHELKTPLAAVLGFADFLSRSAALPEKERRDVERIRWNARHLLEILEDLLNLSKASAGVLEVTLETRLLQDLLVNCREGIKPLAQQKGLLLETALPPEPVPVTTDVVRFTQVMNNLVGNAVKYTEQGSVRITADVEPPGKGPGLVRIHVSDTGPGIPAEELPRIFEPFHRPKGVPRKEGGTGLGLSVAKRLAALLGGDVTAESAPGKGSTFTFIHPLAGGRRLSL